MSYAERSKLPFRKQLLVTIRETWPFLVVQALAAFTLGYATSHGWL